MPVEVVEYRDGELVASPPPGAEPSSAEGQSDAAGRSQTGSQGDSVAPPAAPAAADAGEGSAADVDEADLSPETATVDYVARRINRLTARHRAAERALETERQQNALARAQLEGQIQMLTRVLQGQAPTGDDVPQGPQGPPQSEDFQTHDDYVRALTRHEMHQERQQQDQQRQQEMQRQQQADLQRQLQEREQAFRQTHPDFDDVVRSALVGRVAPHVQYALMALPEGPALAYALARQPETLQRLNTLPPMQVVAEMARLVPPASPPAATSGLPAGLTTTGASGTRAAPPAPAGQLAAPLTPLSGSGAPATAQTYSEEMTQEQYRAMRKATSQLANWKQR